MKLTKSMKGLPLLLPLLLFLTGPAPAQENIQLKQGPGRDLVLASCSGCHSLDYIQMNSPFLDHKGWEKEVDKMMKAFGAAVDPKNVPPIVDYLTKAYGK